jgi:hypothetical protein
MEKKVSSISVLAAYSGRDNGYPFCHDDVRYRGGRVFQVRHFFLGEARFRFFCARLARGLPPFFSWAARVAPRVFRAFEMTLPWRRPRESCARGSRSTTRTSRCARRTKALKGAPRRVRVRSAASARQGYGEEQLREDARRRLRGDRASQKRTGHSRGAFTCCVTPLIKKTSDGFGLER